MALLSYTTIMSLDGYVADESGSFDWAQPDEEVHQFANDLARPVSTHLYGRRMYEVMSTWETDPSLAASSPTMADFAEIWRAADKIVYSSTLPEPMTSNTRIEREFDLRALRRMKQTSSGEIAIAGPTLAAVALRAGMVDEVCVFVAPVVVGGGLPAFPPGLRLNLRVLGRRAFDARGMVFMRAAVG